MVINKSGITIRIGVDTLRVMGRATQGVKLFVYGITILLLQPLLQKFLNLSQKKMRLSLDNRRQCN